MRNPLSVVPSIPMWGLRALRLGKFFIQHHAKIRGSSQRLRSTTLGLNDRPLVNTSRRINASPANIRPVNTSTNDGFPTWVNQELGPDPLATAPDGHPAPFFAGTFSVNALVNNDVSPLVNPGLGTDFANGVPEDAWIAPTSTIGNATSFSDQVHESWNHGRNLATSSTFGMGVNTDTDMHRAGNLNADQDFSSRFPLFPCEGLLGLGQLPTYGYQVIPTMGISSVALNDAGCYFQALPIQGFLQQQASPLGAIIPVVPAPDFAAPPTQGPFACTQLNCFSTFIRDKDRARRESSVHGIGRPLYLCQVPGCIKSIGAGYTRKDKLTEHMWKKHGNLGHVKRT